MTWRQQVNAHNVANVLIAQDFQNEFGKTIVASIWNPHTYWQFVFHHLLHKIENEPCQLVWHKLSFRLHILCSVCGSIEEMPLGGIGPRQLRWLK
jgi:hypothetical protein